MKVYKKHIRLLQILNLASAVVILVTIFYSWSVLKKLPENIWVYKGWFDSELTQISKASVWQDIRLMITCYLVFSLITVFTEVTPFKRSSGFHMAQMISVFNFCICLVFAVTITGTICACKFNIKL